jgi:hypothetical protein
MFERAAVAALHGLGMRLWGFRPRLMAAFVQQHGGLPTLRWFARNMPRYERTRRELGPQRTHLLATAISLEGGCAYCAYGHAYAMDLLHLRDHGSPFPLPVSEVLALCGQDRAVIVERLGDALRGAELADEIAWITRLHTARDDGDARLTHLLDMFAVLNACGVACQVPADEAHDPINKDEALKQRLARLRAQEVGER